MARRRMLSPYATKAELSVHDADLRAYIHSEHERMRDEQSQQHSSMNSHVQHNQEQIWEAINELRHDSQERHNQVMTLLVQLGRDK